MGKSCTVTLTDQKS